MNIDEMVRGTQDAANVRRVYGEPIVNDGITIIPVAKVTGGGGGGADTQNNGGGGFMIRAHPLGAYVIKEGNVRFEPVIDVSRIVLGAQITAMVVALALRAIFGRRREGGRR